MKSDSLDFRKMNELIPTVAQDYLTKEVLMLAYMNKEAFELTQKTGYAWYWSKERKKLWRKGETSGNDQLIKEIRVDCDLDAVLLLVEQKGVACHTGNKTCFYNILKTSE